MATKIKYEDIKQSINNSGWKLISDQYINLKTDLEVICPEGHTNFVNYDKWRKGNYECPICKQNPFYKTKNVAIKKKGHRILAFDQASILSGWAVFDESVLIDYGKWSSNGTKSTERIAQTKYWVASMIDKFKPDEIVFEDIQLQKFEDGNEAVVTFKKLAHLQGVLINYCYENRFHYQVVPSSTWRAHSLIKGKTRTDKKRNAQLKVKTIYDISVSQDEADAILLAKYAADTRKTVKIISF